MKLDSLRALCFLTSIMIDRITAKRIVPVVVLDHADSAEPLAEALMEGGLDIMEITFRTAAAEE